MSSYETLYSEEDEGALSRFSEHIYYVKVSCHPIHMLCCHMPYFVLVSSVQFFTELLKLTI